MKMLLALLLTTPAMAGKYDADVGLKAKTVTLTTSVYKRYADSFVDELDPVGGGDDSGMVNVVDPDTGDVLGAMWVRSVHGLPEESFWFLTSTELTAGPLTAFDLEWQGSMNQCDAIAYLDATFGISWRLSPMIAQGVSGVIPAPGSDPYGPDVQVQTPGLTRVAYTLRNRSGEVHGTMMDESFGDNRYHHWSFDTDMERLVTNLNQGDKFVSASGYPLRVDSPSDFWDQATGTSTFISHGTELTGVGFVIPCR